MKELTIETLPVEIKVVRVGGQDGILCREFPK